MLAHQLNTNISIVLLKLPLYIYVNFLNQNIVGTETLYNHARSPVVSVHRYTLYIGSFWTSDLGMTHLGAEKSILKCTMKIIEPENAKSIILYSIISS